MPEVRRYVMRGLEKISSGCLWLFHILIFNYQSALGKIRANMGSITEEKHINLQLGWPSPALFPSEALITASQAVLGDPKIAAQALVYGPDPGHEALRSAIASWLFGFYHPEAGPIDPSRIFVTNGASGALSMLLTRFTDPEYTKRIWAIEPTYFLAAQAFQDAGFDGRMRGVPEDDEGIDIDFLRQGLLESEKEPAKEATFKGAAACPKIYKHIIYAIPTFSNPSAKTMSLRRREQLVQLAREFDALVITDDVYDWLRWPASETGQTQLSQPPPRLVDVDRKLPGTTTFGNAVSNGSFSKIVGPGVRVGWVEGSPDVVKELCKYGPVRSGGCQGHLSSMFISHLVSSGALEKHIQETLIPTYQQRYYAMMESLKTHLLPLGFTISPTGDYEGSRGPVEAGGFFTYINVPTNTLRTSELVEHALDRFNLRVAHGGMMLVAGDPDCASRASQGFGQALRLCWAWHEKEDIDEGIRRLAAAFQSIQAR
ncbi:uncharacterized protein E0L32_006634 [Thyridium curvatum]|uniref:Aminotransferase class I/classII large domain-containing protein n=1 Tax=Thyridium curvatum TaxID=1093900 RepID=A0A507B6I4_9PEZI|nr:uncharacterized protein E0L32_006634 [Thyridium curvatum]TPX12989.1 hypothetical protein E0L32_006634 [Thyridium curvatum]